MQGGGTGKLSAAASVSEYNNSEAGSSEVAPSASGSGSSLIDATGDLNVYGFDHGDLPF